jgi:hypothetical protein
VRDRFTSPYALRGPVRFRRLTASGPSLAARGATIGAPPSSAVTRPARCRSALHAAPAGLRVPGLWRRRMASTEEPRRAASRVHCAAITRPAPVLPGFAADWSAHEPFPGRARSCGAVWPNSHPRYPAWRRHHLHTGQPGANHQPGSQARAAPDDIGKKRRQPVSASIFLATEAAVSPLRTGSALP